jgi:hypothetical protein
MEENLQADFRFRVKAWCDNTVPQDEADAYVAALWPDAISV